MPGPVKIIPLSRAGTVSAWGASGRGVMGISQAHLNRGLTGGTTNNPKSLCVPQPVLRLGGGSPATA